MINYVLLLSPSFPAAAKFRMFRHTDTHILTFLYIRSQPSG